MVGMTSSGSKAIHGEKHLANYQWALASALYATVIPSMRMPVRRGLHFGGLEQMRIAKLD